MKSALRPSLPIFILFLCSSLCRGASDPKAALLDLEMGFQKAWNDLFEPHVDPNDPILAQVGHSVIRVSDLKERYAMLPTVQPSTGTLSPIGPHGPDTKSATIKINSGPFRDQKNSQLQAMIYALVLSEMACQKGFDQNEVFRRSAEMQQKQFLATSYRQYLNKHEFPVTDKEIQDYYTQHYKKAVQPGKIRAAKGTSPSPASYESKKDEIRQLLQAKKFMEWLIKAKSTLGVKVDEPLLKSIDFTAPERK